MATLRAWAAPGVRRGMRVCTGDCSIRLLIKGSFSPQSHRERRAPPPGMTGSREMGQKCEGILSMSFKRLWYPCSVLSVTLWWLPRRPRRRQLGVSVEASALGSSAFGSSGFSWGTAGLRAASEPGRSFLVRVSPSFGGLDVRRFAGVAEAALVSLHDAGVSARPILESGADHGEQLLHDELRIRRRSIAVRFRRHDFRFARPAELRRHLPARMEIPLASKRDQLFDERPQRSRPATVMMIARAGE